MTKNKATASTDRFSNCEETFSRVIAKVWESINGRMADEEDEDDNDITKSLRFFFQKF